MKTKMKWLVAVGIGAVGIGAGLAIAADYRVPKSWSRNGMEAVKSSTTVYEAGVAAAAKLCRFRYQVVSQPEDKIVEYTLAQINALPDAVTNNISGAVTPNVFKTRLKRWAESEDVVIAFNWVLVDGRESAMVPVPSPGNP